ncbi:MAG TPA: translation elongation factor-like protein [Candidatus Pacearchaeota archaeon]|nr:translation elongation factor-like protein [Candidatus Parcubacteria bacterium]HNP79334.1 translation elongation factor-like protein [Candidatus Pacearchaeota archaeon]HQM24593.1 translation elongation factor-like protein [Candidatus Pacearchaeota archaeon]
MKKIIKKEKRIGKIKHYFGKIKVGVIKLTDTLSVGDEIMVKSKTEERFKQKVSSIEVDGKKLKKAKKGQIIGLKLKDKAREDYLVFKI